MRRVRKRRSCFGCESNCSDAGNVLAEKNKHSCRNTGEARGRLGVALLDVQRVVGPGLGHIQESGVLVAQHRVVPQVGHPHGHQQRRAAEAQQQEEAVAVGAEAFVTLVRHHGDHGQECEEEKLGDLSLGHQVP